mgnify:CR=1 FL=1
MNKETIKYIIRDFHEKSLPDVVNRSLDLPLDSGKIVTLVGIRRSGKTFFMFQTMHQLIKTVSKENIIYLNFEDDRLFPVSLDRMDLILKSFHELYPDKIDEKKYIFFDEIQNVPHWEKYCRRIYDQENVSIFLTGSSSQLLSGNIASALRGRTITFEIYPLSFIEFLKFQEVSVKPYSERSRVSVEHAFDHYIEIGGFPEIVLSNPSIRQKILLEYTDLLLYKDLVEQYDIKNQYVLKYLLKYCFLNPSTLVSTNKLYHDLKSQGVSVSKNTLYEYLEYMKHAFIIFDTQIYDRSVRKQIQNPKKLYVIDTGLMSQFVANPFSDIGHKLENIIFLYLHQLGYFVYYYRNSVEIDFVVETADQLCFINVCYDVKNQVSTLKREIRALEVLKERFPQARYMLITRGPVEEDIIPSFIEIKNVVHFLQTPVL